MLRLAFAILALTKKTQKSKIMYEHQSLILLLVFLK